jgi:CheY-like chemotaxis protein
VTRTHVAAADRIRSAEAGADHLLVKPFSLRELAVRARQLVARYRGRPVPAGGGLGELPGDPLVTYDEFVERLLLSSGGAARALVGCRLAAREAVETGRVVDIVRCELRPEDVMAYEPDERHLVALVSPEAAEELAGHLSRRVRELAGADLTFWVAPVAKGAAVRVLTEQFERERRAGDRGVEVTP